MKELNEINVPPELKYTEDHEWAGLDDGTVTIGVTDYAQDQLGDIVFAELPEVGETFEKGQVFGTLESVKAVSELFMPITGEILAANEALGEEPDLVNREPYAQGWMIKIKPSDPAELDTLMDRDAYVMQLKG